MVRRAVVGLCVALAVPLGAQPASQSHDDLPSHLAKIGASVEQYFGRVRSLVCREEVELQPLRPDFQPDGRARDLEYELRVDWAPPATGIGPPEATIQRTLIEVDGRPPRPRDRPSCMDPKPVSPEPLAMLLPHRQGGFSFTVAGRDRIDGRATVVLAYRSLSKEPPTVTWKDECVTVDLLSMTRGRIWADASTGEVLRLDESLTGLYEFPVPMTLQRRGGPVSLVVERSDTTIRYRAVSFTDPDESILLPVSIETLTIVRGAGVPWQRMVQRFSDYRRFITGGRIIP
jgi:hypothetical protein